MNSGDSCMGDSQFGVTFFTSSQRQDTCGSNGLPLTPNSIRILGRSRFLKSLIHTNLAEYIEVIRGKHERIIVVSEFYPTCLLTLLKTQRIDTRDNLDKVLKLVVEVLKALSYLNDQGIVCRNLCLENIVFDGSMTAKLFNYGLYYITNSGQYVMFPIGQPKYTAPEVFLSGDNRVTDLFSCDVWSLGIILVELCLGKPIWQDLKLGQIIQKVVELSRSDTPVLKRLLTDLGAPTMFQDLDERLVTILNLCLLCDVSKRPSPKELLNQIESDRLPSPIKFSCTVIGGESCSCELPNGHLSGNLSYRPVSFSLLLTKPLYRSYSGTIADQEEVSAPTSSGSLFRRSLKEVFYFWQLAGGDVIAELKRQGLTRKKPAVLSLPRSMTLAGEYIGSAKERGLLLDNTVIVLPLRELIKRLSRMPPSTYFPLIVSQIPGMNDDALDITKDSIALPLVIRERDIEYQFNRILLFDRLLRGFPYTKDLIYKECLVDIPPFFRAQIWAALLGIQGDVQGRYAAIDKETPTSTDRQIEVDIPRCHQYDELLSSPSGHQKFKRILKAWVVSNKEYVYWQGLDSLCAPFLYLNFNNEAMAYACLSSFIPKYLYNFFLKDNSAVIQEYLAKFSQLIAFHDPQLTNHLDSIGFIPELYAIPWFLTMFSHVFPLHKIFHLWDKLLLGDASFSLCIGLSILFQLREGLLNSGFNECILLFSDMPEINIEKCVVDSVQVYSNTPKSVLCRKHQPPTSEGRSIVLKNLGDSEVLPTTFHYSGCDFPVNQALKMDPISLVELKKEKCAHISGEDLLLLFNLKKSSSVISPSVIVLDVRNREDYNRGAIPGSFNMPYNTAFGPDGTLTSSEDATYLTGQHNAVVVVVGNRGEAATKFAEKLLRLEYSKVCILHGGIDIFRAGNILVVPSTV